MTFVYKTTRVNNYLIELYQDKFDVVYRVRVLPIISDDYCGFPVSDLSYTEEKQALRRYNRAIKYYKGV